MNSVTPQLSVKALSKRFGGNAAVQDCTFDVWPGSVTGFIGPNGAGKSTVFNLISGLIKADSGSVLFEGQETTRLPTHRVARLGLARTFQIPRELGGLSVMENLLLVPRPQFGERLGALLAPGGRVRDEEARNRTRAEQVLEFVEMTQMADARASSLSGGQKKLLELARCLMADPRLILLDEPTAGVNPRLIGDLVTVLRRLHDRGVTLAIIEHNMNLIMEFCERVVVLDAGRVLTEGAPEEVRRDKRVLEAYLGSPAHD